MRFLKALLGEFLTMLPRLSGWMLVAIALTGAVGLLHPSLLMVSLYKLSLAVTSGIVGYFLDRAIFPYARPDCFTAKTGFEDYENKIPPVVIDERCFSAAMIRRALIVAAMIVGVCLGA